ncbi:hepatic lectin-like [Gymnodraco acuticeps]|uniref:Hepatic lectin-like n=1 Tax=Gymnodraco acuticeps TaxID=8218 RepID=A0A6P8X8Z0_GYMAC|nr:hepatic lectin-like [Gymnodraco acuticeps]
MPEAEVLYSDVKFKRDKGNNDGRASSAADTIYSAVRILEKQPSTELPGSQQQSESAPRCRVTSERAAVIVLSVLLAASLVTLGVTSHQNIQTIERLRKMTDERGAEMKNLTERFSAVKPCKPEPTCPAVNRGSCKRCPDSWERHGGKCYYLSIIKATWTQSRAECRRTGGDLVQIESREEQTFLQQKVRVQMTGDEDKFWIGLTDSVTEGAWLWTDGSALDRSLAFWSTGEPDNYKGNDTMEEDCARMGERGGASDLKCWFDKSCEDPHRSICEKPEDP